MLCGPDGELPEKLRNLEPRLIEHVSNEIMDRDPNVRWEDIGNLLSFEVLVEHVFVMVLVLSILFYSWFRPCQEMCDGDGGLASVAT